MLVASVLGAVLSAENGRKRRTRGHELLLASSSSCCLSPSLCCLQRERARPFSQRRARGRGSGTARVAGLAITPCAPRCIGRVLAGAAGWLKKGRRGEWLKPTHNLPREPNISPTRTSKQAPSPPPRGIYTDPASNVDRGRFAALGGAPSGGRGRSNTSLTSFERRHRARRGRRPNDARKRTTREKRPGLGGLRSFFQSRPERGPAS
jgi:hypothetical protein